MVDTDGEDWWLALVNQTTALKTHPRSTKWFDRASMGLVLSNTFIDVVEICGNLWQSVAIGSNLVNYDR